MDSSTKEIENGGPKKRRRSVDIRKCIVCQDITSSKKRVENPKKESVQKLLEKVEERAKYGDQKYVDCLEKIREVDKDQIIYHLECYKSTANKTEIDRCRKRFENKAETPREERRNEVDAVKDKTVKTLRSNSTTYDKTRCIICQDPGGKLRTVQYIKTGERMLEVARKLPEPQFFLRMNNISSASDAVANDVKYHLTCWIKAQRGAATPSMEVQDIEDVNRVLAGIEIVNMVEQVIHETNNVADMNSLNTTYNNLLDNGTGEQQNYKKYLKRLLEENIPDIVFSRPPSRTQPERVCSSTICGDAVNKSYNNSSEEYSALFEVAKLVRRKILVQEKWQFTGDFSGFSIPQELKLLLHWIITGPKTTVDTGFKKKAEVDKSVSVLSEVVMNSVKTNRQVNTQGTFRQIVETPFTVGLGMHVHKTTRSKTLVDMLSSFNLSISYDKILKFETLLANAVVKESESHNGVFVPPNVVEGTSLHFAIDNVDFKNDTPEGKDEFHGTGMVVFQKFSNKNVSNLVLDRSRGKAVKLVEYSLLSEHKEKPTPQKEIFPTFNGIVSCDHIKLYQNQDQIWNLCQVIEDEMTGSLPTWAAYNSLLMDKEQPTICQGLPLYPSSPTDWSTLYTSLKVVQGLNVVATGSRRTIITLDLQLYSKCIQLREDNVIKQNFVFRLGELHIVFAMLKVLGKYIECSGLDSLFIESGVYGGTTLKQILQGKHMKRGVEAHAVMYLALYRIFYKEWIGENNQFSEAISEIKETLADLSNVSFEDPEKYKIFNERLLQKVESHGIISDLESFRHTLKNQGQFYSNYMKMFECLLLFTRSSRQGLWRLHLATLSEFTKYFFAHDQLNYARLSPVYVASMLELEQTDPGSWEYLEENFSINKNGTPFTSIGSDHALEQDNKRMKVNGGIVGLTQNPTALKRFCLIAPTLNSLSEQFCSQYDVNVDHREKHYQLTGSYLSRIIGNAKKILETMQNFDLSFIQDGPLTNIVSNAVLSESASNEILCHEKIGADIYNEFINKRLHGEMSVWDPVQRRNLKTFKSELTKKVKSTVDGKVVQLKEEKSLLSRFLITSRKRPEIDLEFCLGNFEFTVVPKALFSSDGEPLPCSDKSKILHQIEQNLKEHDDQMDLQTESTDEQRRVIIIDGMAIVNQLNKNSKVKTCKDLADIFTRKIISLGQNCSEVRLVFDRYVRDSLKARTRRKRTSGNEVRYKISDATNISNTSLKQLLSHIDTKQELTIFLAHHTTNALNLMGKRYVVTYDLVSETNIQNFAPEMTVHDHEEADTLLIFHCHDIAKEDPFAECIVLSPDTDVFLLLIHHYPSLTQSVIFRTGRGDNIRDISIGSCYESIGTSRAKALLGFHTLTGCDQTGRFHGKSKVFWWKEFCAAENDIVEAISELGKDSCLPSLDVLSCIEKWIVQAYGGKKLPENIDTIPKLRWYLFSKFQYSVEKLPPTAAALKLKVFRSHYVTLVLRRACMNLQRLPSFEGFGWEVVNDRIVPIMTDELPAPVALIELSVCSCKKAKCDSNRCKCYKNNLQCTDMCKCLSCENTDDQREEEIVESEDETLGDDEVTEY